MNQEDDVQELTSWTEEAWDGSKTDTNIELAQVTPGRSVDKDKEDAPCLGNVFGLINMLTRPTAKKVSGDAGK